MPDAPSRFGLSAALTTPFDVHGAIDLKRMTDHAASVIAHGCDGVTLFGTTGEGASIALGERYAAIGAMAGADINLRESVIVGVAATVVADAVDQARAGYDFDCRGILLAPPFYFKGLTDDALFAWFAATIERLGARARDIILYHIPSVTGAPLSVALVTRLRRAFGDVILGVKDSGGDWAHTSALLAAHRDSVILVGDERHLAAAVRAGGSGAISGLANVAPGPLSRLIATGESNPRLSSFVDEVVKLPVMAAVKALVAARYVDDAWRAMRPPLAALDAASARRIVQTFQGSFAASAA